jgi:hypothetical protein
MARPELPLSEVGNGAFKALVKNMVGKLSPKTQRTYLSHAKQSLGGEKSNSDSRFRHSFRSQLSVMSVKIVRQSKVAGVG